MDVNNGLEAIRQIKAAFPWIGLSIHGDQKMAMAMREAGVSAYLSKGGSFDMICSTIRSSLTQASEFPLSLIGLFRLWPIRDRYIWDPDV
jgi:DNA-binding NarL/FixJ family response regulator